MAKEGKHNSRKRTARELSGTIFGKMAESKFSRDGLERQRNKQLGIGPASPVRRIDPATGEVIEVIAPASKPSVPRRRRKWDNFDLL